VQVSEPVREGHRSQAKSWLARAWLDLRFAVVNSCEKRIERFEHDYRAHSLVARHLGGTDQGRVPSTRSGEMNLAVAFKPRGTAENDILVASATSEIGKIKPTGLISIVADATIVYVRRSYRTLKGPAKFMRRFATISASEQVDLGHDCPIMLFRS
jgi:hypothetical protein